MQRKILIHYFPVDLQQFGPILDVEIIFNERGSKVRAFLLNYNLL